MVAPELASFCAWPYVLSMYAGWQGYRIGLWIPTRAEMTGIQPLIRRSPGFLTYFVTLVLCDTFHDYKTRIYNGLGCALRETLL